MTTHSVDLLRMIESHGLNRDHVFHATVQIDGDVMVTNVWKDDARSGPPLIRHTARAEEVTT